MNNIMRRILAYLFLTIALLTNCLAQNIRISDEGDVDNTFIINCDNANSEYSTSVYFFDSGGSGTYRPNESYRRNISSTNGGSISIKFTQFNLALGTFLTIKDAISQQILVSNATGTSLNGQTITSNRGALQFIWSSGATGGPGFKAKVWCGSMCQVFSTTIVSSVAQTYEGDPQTGISEIYYGVCHDEEVSFTANSDFPNNNNLYAQSDSTLDYTWGVVYMGDTILTHTGVGGNTFSNAFHQGGGYYIFCNAVDSNGCINRNINTKKVRVSLHPVPESVSFFPDSVCTGTQVTMFGAPYVEPWIDFNADIFNVISICYDDYACYPFHLYSQIYPDTAIINSIDDIERIYINMEHSYLGDLSILVKCPNGQSCLLKAYNSGTPTIAPGWSITTVNNPDSYGGNIIHLGLAPDPSSGTACYYTAGEGYSYNFTPSATQPMGGSTSSASNPNITSISYTDPCGNTETSYVLNPGDYASYESMSSLVGCPLNGLWTLYVCDHLNYDNGFVFEWGIFFNEEINYDYLWSYSNTYLESSFSWSGEGLQTGMNGDSYATAIVHNSDTSNWREIPYTFTATDNFGCTYDTTIIVHVKPAMYEDCDSTITMNETELTEEISIIPNPVHDIINIYSPETISEIEIVNTLGKVVKRVDVNAYNVACNVEDLPNGLYVVRIYANSHAEHSRSARVVRKFIKE